MFYLFESVRERKRREEGEHELPFLGSLPSWAQQLDLGQPGQKLFSGLWKAFILNATNT